MEWTRVHRRSHRRPSVRRAGRASGRASDSDTAPASLGFRYSTGGVGSARAGYTRKVQLASGAAADECDRRAAQGPRGSRVPAQRHLRAPQFDDSGTVEMHRFVAKLGALGHLSRLEIFRSLVRAGPEGRCVEAIRERIPMAAPTLSHHLDVLRRSGLVDAQRQGRFIYYAINWPETSSLLRFLTEDCCADLHHPRAAAASSALTRSAPSQTSRRRRRTREIRPNRSAKGSRR
jgi:ArsR family transcriptional regulator